MNTTHLALLQSVRKNGTLSKVLPTEALSAESTSRPRRRFFSSLRVCAAGLLAMAATVAAVRAITTVQSDQAYLNAAITSLRAPIPGQLQLESLEPGTPVSSGTP